MKCHTSNLRSDEDAAMPEMIPIASADGVTIHCPREGRYAFYNSPYPAHRLDTGVDIYNENQFGEIAACPIEGEVTLIRKVRAPRGRNFKDHGYDVVTLLKSLEEPGKMVKILHLEPTVRVGEKIEAGQELGILIRSGYFGFSTAPHIHLEVRNEGDPLRARGGIRLSRMTEVGERVRLDELVGVVIRSYPQYTVLEISGVNRYGLPCDVEGTPGVLDGGIPYYGWHGAHTGSRPPEEGYIRLCGESISKIVSWGEKACTAECLDFSFTVEDVSVGLSLFIHPRERPKVYLIPRRPGDLGLEGSSEISIKMVPPPDLALQK